LWAPSAQAPLPAPSSWTYTGVVAPAWSLTREEAQSFDLTDSTRCLKQASWVLSIYGGVDPNHVLPTDVSPTLPGYFRSQTDKHFPLICPHSVCCIREVRFQLPGGLCTHWNSYHIALVSYFVCPYHQLSPNGRQRQGCKITEACTFFWTPRSWQRHIAEYHKDAPFKFTLDECKRANTPNPQYMGVPDMTRCAKPSLAIYSPKISIHYQLPEITMRGLHMSTPPLDIMIKMSESNHPLPLVVLQPLQSTSPGTSSPRKRAIATVDFPPAQEMPACCGSRRRSTNIKIVVYGYFRSKNYAYH
jgi:hypothetical protein